MQYYRSVKDPRTDLRRRMHEIAQTRGRYGYRRVHVLWRRQVRHAPKRTNEVWSMDFVADQLAHGAKLRMLTIVDVCTKECLAIQVDRNGPTCTVLRRTSRSGE